MKPIRFHCPSCNQLDAIPVRGDVCPRCGFRYLADGGVLNLVPLGTDRGDEQAFYNSVYREVGPNAGRALTECLRLWERREQPELAIVRNATGNLAAKDVLLLGNGASHKELAFLLDRPNTLVYSDLSPYAARRIKQLYDLSQHHDRIVFAALDAQELPFAAESFDIVYAYAMVHHLPRLDQFLREVRRVLRPGGRAIFMDDAYSPIWHHAKRTWLRPIMRYSHRRTGISPEDYRFSMTGGFKEADLAAEIRAAGAEPWFVRTSLMTYIVFRGIEKLLPLGLSESLKTSWLPNLTTRLDQLLGRFRFVRSNQIRLIWGLVRTEQT